MDELQCPGALLLSNNLKIMTIIIICDDIWNDLMELSTIDN